jgi:hypothetical protein
MRDDLGIAAKQTASLGAAKLNVLKDQQDSRLCALCGNEPRFATAYGIGFDLLCASTLRQVSGPRQSQSNGRPSCPHSHLRT